MAIETVNIVMDTDDTVALFEVTDREGQNEPPRVIMNAEGILELTEVHEWLSNNGQPIPEYSSFLVGAE
jgi:hypothetical protein